MARRMVGSNQYKTRLGANVGPQGPDLMVLAAAEPEQGLPQQLPCYQVWGGSCTLVVSAPRWSHSESHAECDQLRIAGMRKNVDKLPMNVLINTLMWHPDGHRLLTSKQCPPELHQWVATNFDIVLQSLKTSTTCQWPKSLSFTKTVLSADWCPPPTGT
jgi:hypothetical protein